MLLADFIFLGLIRHFAILPALSFDSRLTFAAKLRPSIAPRHPAFPHCMPRQTISALAAKALPTGILPTEVLPTEVFPAEVLPAEVLPTELLPTEALFTVRLP